MNTLALHVLPRGAPHSLKAWAARLPQLTPTRIVLGFTVLAISAIWSCALLFLGLERQRTLDAALVTASGYVRGVEEHAVRTFEAADQTVVFFKFAVATEGPAIDVPGYLRRGIVKSDIFNLISITDEHGIVRAASEPFETLDLSDREHIRVHFQHDTNQLFISKPVRGRVSGRWSIQMTRRANKPDGSLAGVVVISMDPFYFTQFYQQIEPGTQTMVALMGEDGIARARRVGTVEQVGEDVRQSPIFQTMLHSQQPGTLIARGGLDGRVRLYAYRHLAGFPMYAIVGIDQEEALAPYYRSRNNTITWAAASTAFLLLFLIVIAKVIGRLESSEREALASSQAKSEFLATMSHELRTPLHGILGYAELIGEISEDAAIGKYIQAVAQSGRHLLQLVNEVLDLGRIESGHAEVIANTFRLPEFLREVAGGHRASAALKQLNLNTEIDDDLPAQITTDEVKLRQLLNNLLHNAIKFTQAGSVTLKARVSGRRVLLQVIDTGCGIPESSLDRIFEKFVQANSTLQRSHEGTGLGLALVKQLCLLLGFEVRVKSQLGVGSRFSVSIPIEHCANPSEKGNPR